MELVTEIPLNILPSSSVPKFESVFNLVWFCPIRELYFPLLELIILSGCCHPFSSFPLTDLHSRAVLFYFEDLHHIHSVDQARYLGVILDYSFSPDEVTLLILLLLSVYLPSSYQSLRYFLSGVYLSFISVFSSPHH